MFHRDVFLAGWTYDVEPHTGFVFGDTPEPQWNCTEPPRLVSPAFAPPDRHFMRDPSLTTTWHDTGGTPQVASSSFRSLVRPWSGTG